MTGRAKACTEVDLVVVGAGVAGLSAALFASARGIASALVGGPGSLLFASGFFDLLGIHPVEEGRVWNDPWAGIQALRKDAPSHPLARIEDAEIRQAVDGYLHFLDAAGLPHARREGRNVRVLTPMGTAKVTHAVPCSMWNGVEALHRREPCLIADFHGLKEFNATQLVSTLQASWSGLRAVRLSFPGLEHRSRLFTRHMAQALEIRENQEKLVQRLAPHARHVTAVGLPALCGLRRSDAMVRALGEAVGAPVFEIPTLPASVPGIRLKETFERGLVDRGVRSFFQGHVRAVFPEGSDGFVLDLGDGAADGSIRARGVILATGRFFGTGLRADRDRVREPLFDLPVRQPPARKDWHRLRLFDPRGHAINRAGLEVDERFRPVDARGRPVFEGLFAAGSILAHQDWMRMKCGSGLAVATASAAVRSFEETCGSGGG